MLIVQDDRHFVANRLANSPAGLLDPAAPLLTLRGFCPQCGAASLELRDDLSLREFRISGLCQSCQDAIFDGGPREIPVDPATFS